MFKEQTELYENRIQVFLVRLEELFYAEKVPLAAEYALYEPMVPFSERFNKAYKAIAVGDTWGSNWQRAWFHIHGSIPSAWQGKRVVAKINLGGEACLFDKEGVPVQGLSFHTLWMDKFVRDRFDISESAIGGEDIDLWLEASASQLFGLELERDPGRQSPRRYGHYQAAVRDLDLALFRDDIWQLYLDVFVLNDLMKSLPEDSVRRARILRAINAAIDIFQEGVDTTLAARQLLQSELNKSSSESDLETVAVGHAHIDTAWLWPIEETIRKCARTYSSQIRLLEKYPHYVFGASQPQHYVFIKEYYPQLYEKIREKVAQGRWEPQGGMWVEPDCNLADGESLVRQILYGKTFFQKEFGINLRHLWIPDVFGYSAAMPQILKKSGIDYLVTQKLSWNQFNKFPHNTFNWQGIDGSRVIAHFPPENNYNSQLLPSALRKARSNFAEKGFLDSFLTLFGIGDGGGGPTEEIIETGLRQKNLEGTPRVRFGRAQDFLDGLAQSRDNLPVWNGELYLELHRGTLTTQAYNKKMNRRLEHRLRQVEILYSSLPAEMYPAGELEKMWKVLLLHQFHDILPGSSINIVYKESRRAYEELQKQTDELVKAFAEKALIPRDECLSIINTSSCTYTRPIVLPAEWFDCAIQDADGKAVPCQSENHQTVVAVTVPPFESVTLKPAGPIVASEPPQAPDDFILENQYVKYSFDSNGCLVSCFDKEAHRELFADRMRGNLLCLYEDRPANWDAWDVDIFYENQLLERARVKTMSWCAYGPVRQGLELCFEIGNSEIFQRIYLSSNSKRLDFETRVNWQERHKMLRVGFKVDVHAPEATYDIQFGYLKRPTHRNTSWDMARFEGVAHKYIDLSDVDYGVALLNDCKYGHKVFQNYMEINLLRSPTNPDPDADVGRHEFTYSFLPHKGGLVGSSVFAEAAQLNKPPAIIKNYDAGRLFLPFRISNDDIVLEVIKKAEKGKDMVVRLYEPQGRSASCRLVSKEELNNVYEVDLMEEHDRPLSFDGSEISLNFRPFEIKTIKIEYGKK